MKFKLFLMCSTAFFVAYSELRTPTTPSDDAISDSKVRAVLEKIGGLIPVT